MATRRARIKAVASLPVRRKNADIKPNISPKFQNEAQTCESTSTDVSTKRHIEQTPSSENKNVSTVMSSRTVLPHADPELSETIKPKTRNIKQNNPMNNSVTMQITDASAQPIVDTHVESVTPKNPSKIDITSSIQHTSNFKSPSNNVIKILSNNIISTTAQNIEKACSSDSRVSDSQNIEKARASVSKDAIVGIDKVGETGEADGSVDGIMPLETAHSRTVEQLKSEIFSETAEVLFDPIVSLPSHGKLRHKLKPSPRITLPSLRRNSMQGSASESEDDHKRVLHGPGAAATVATGGSSLGPPVKSGPGRIRHDSQSSFSTHQSHIVVRDSGRTRNDSMCSEKPLVSRSRRNESTRLNALRQKMQARGDVIQRDQLTMYDLIFYNPTANPIVETKDKKRRSKKMKEEESEEEDAALEDMASAGSEEGEGGEEAGGGEAEEGSGGPGEAAPAPQIKLGANGEILIDEKSLVIKQTTNQNLLSTSVVNENEWCRGGNGPGGRYNRAPRTKKWSDEETVRFYRALAAVGTDFSLMLPLFPDRSRKDIKTKFKKEERINRSQVDKALKSHTDFDLESLSKQFARERLEAEERARRFEEEAREIERAERERVKRAREQGKASKSAMEKMNKQQSLGMETAQDISSFDSGTSEKSKSLPPPHKDVTRKVVTAPIRKPALVPGSPPRSNPLNKLASATQSYDLPPDVDPMSVAKDVAPGSLVCLTIPDPNNPSKKVLQTYVADGAGNMTPISLPHDMLKSVMDYMNSNAASERESPQLQTSLSSPASTAGKLVKRASEDCAGSIPKSVKRVARDSDNVMETMHPPSLEPETRLQSVMQSSPNTNDSYTITNL